MGFNLMTDDKGCVVYRKDKVSSAGNNYSTYSTKVSSKDGGGNWQSAFLNLKFRKGVEVNNKAKIKIKNAFPTLNTFNGNTSLNWMVMEFDVLEDGEKPVENASLDDGTPAFMDIPEGMEELPFN